MIKLKLTKPTEIKSHGLGCGYDKSAFASNCEIKVPGLGRVRTGFQHANFHVVEPFIKDKVEPTGTTQIRKEEVVHSRQDS